MRNFVSALCLLWLVCSCDNELKLISRDFSVSLKSIDGNTAIVGKAVNCSFTVSGLDEDNTDQILTFFEVEGGNGIILVDDNEYSSGETFEYDYKGNDKLSFDFIPTTAGELYLNMTVASELVKRSDRVKLKVTTPEMNVKFQNVPDMVRSTEEAEFYLLLDTEQYGVKATARFVKGSGQVYISGYEATGNEGVELQRNNLVIFQPDNAGEVIIEFTVSSRYGLPVRKEVIIQVNE